mmetsp:Transcript_6614/g.18994  ORF Transcript_6614/g.18994 Transcript_6614/m.18994 type:complete len:86 (-) Transcript_6614:167-424(-)
MPCGMYSSWGFWWMFFPQCLNDSRMVSCVRTGSGINQSVLVRVAIQRLSLLVRVVGSFRFVLFCSRDFSINTKERSVIDGDGSEL